MNRANCARATALVMCLVDPLACSSETRTRQHGREPAASRTPPDADPQTATPPSPDGGWDLSKAEWDAIRRATDEAQEVEARSRRLEAGSESATAARYPCDRDLTGLYRVHRTVAAPRFRGGGREPTVDCMALYCEDDRMTGWVSTTTTNGFICTFTGNVEATSKRLVFHIAPHYSPASSGRPPIQAGPPCRTTAMRTKGRLRFMSFEPSAPARFPPLVRGADCEEEFCERPGDEADDPYERAILRGTEIPVRERIPLENVDRRNICAMDLPEELRRIVNLGD